ncbi:MAG: cryptochrome/photolyase family protein [Alphaproteobacteria bacterium]
MTDQTPKIILVLGDQLSLDLASLKAADKARDVVLMVEWPAPASRVNRHKQKIALVLSAMRHFAAALRDDGWTVDYRAMGDSPSLQAAVKSAAAEHGADGVLVTEPGNWHLREAMRAWAVGASVDIFEDDRFLCSHADFEDWAEGRKELRMEYFYRDMRRQTGLLMEGDEPAGGQWNFDKENRKPQDSDMSYPALYSVSPDDITQEVLDFVEAEFPDNFGALDGFDWAVTGEEADAALEHFIEHALPRFGDFQDAMAIGEPYLFHARLAAYMNIGLLDPLHVCRRAEAAYNDGHAPLNAVEGFIRQIIGWREFVRGIYWLKMPDYLTANFFENNRPLPDFYWTGDTDMACLGAAIGQTRDTAYAHHIQRLMVTGTFAMLAGIDPREVHEWYLAVYADAYDWVEVPNTLGMSQFADGGVLASKPYAASGNYINKMSDYCSGCRFDVKQKTGADACPFNSLYWDFLARHRGKLEGNHRLGMVYRTWDKMDDERQAALRESAGAFLEDL